MFSKNSQLHVAAHVVKELDQKVIFSVVLLGERPAIFNIDFIGSILAIPPLLSTKETGEKAERNLFILGLRTAF